MKIEDDYGSVDRNKSIESNLEMLFTYGRKALSASEFSNAYHAFEKILQMEPNNEEAHLGLLKTRYQASDADSLFIILSHLYDEDRSIISYACPERQNSYQ